MCKKRQVRDNDRFCTECHGLAVTVVFYCIPTYTVKLFRLLFKVILSTVSVLCQLEDTGQWYKVVSELWGCTRIVYEWWNTDNSADNDASASRHCNKHFVTSDAQYLIMMQVPANDIKLKVQIKNNTACNSLTLRRVIVNVNLFSFRLEIRRVQVNTWRVIFLSNVTPWLISKRLQRHLGVSWSIEWSAFNLRVE